MEHKPNVLLLYDEFNPSVRLCAYEQLKYLEKKGVIEFVSSSLYKVTKKMCQECNVVVFIRASTSFEQLLIRELKKNNKFIVYVLDDDLFHVPETSVSYKYYSNSFVKKRMIEMMQHSDLLASPSPKLIIKYKRFFNNTLVIEEPCLLPLSQKPKSEFQHNNGKIKIGFAGSVDRSIEFGSFFEDIFYALIKKYGNKIELEFIGAKPNFSSNIAYHYVPYMDSYQEYQHYMQNSYWDIGLAPLTEDAFHQCKHYNKYLEYSSFSIIGIYSNVYPYTRVIQHKKNGLLCDNTCKSWIDAISFLIEQKKERLQIQQNIEEEIRHLYSLDSVSNVFWEKIIDPNRTQYNTRRITGLTIIHFYSFLERSVSFCIRNGCQTPSIVLKKGINYIIQQKRNKLEKVRYRKK